MRLTLKQNAVQSIVRRSIVCSDLTAFVRPLLLLFANDFGCISPCNLTSTFGLVFLKRIGLIGILAQYFGIFSRRDSSILWLHWLHFSPTLFGASTSRW